MITSKAEIDALIPHSGDMVLFDQVVRYDSHHIELRSRRHLDPDHPLRLKGRLESVVAGEYGAQAMAVHSGLHGETAAGYLASLSGLVLHRPCLDEVSGAIIVSADLLSKEAKFLMFRFAMTDEQGQDLAAGKGIIALRDE